jgi:putative phosphoesterase
MRVGIISDIHGNMMALEAVLTALKQDGVDRIVCLGDVAAMGPQPVEVVGRLRALDCPVVMGNCDVWFAEWPLPEEEGDGIFEQVRWAVGQLSSDDIAFMRGFQPTVRLALDDQLDLLCFHGSPRSNEEVILATTPEEQLDEMLGDADATVMIGGHTHLQMVRRYRDGIVANAGSVGRPRNPVAGPEEDRFPPWAEYAIVRGSGGGVSVDLRRVPLDVESMSHMAAESGLPYVEEWIARWQHRKSGPGFR